MHPCRAAFAHVAAALLPLALLTPPALAAQEAATLTVSPLSLSVTRAVPGVDEDSDLARFGGQAGTEVRLLIRAEGKRLIGFDDDASGLTAFTDDKGNSLLEGRGSGRIEGLSWFRSSDRGDIATINVAGRKTPGPGASSLIVSGKLVFEAARKQSTHLHQNAELKKGTKLQAGPIDCEVSQAGKPQWGDEPLEIELKFKGELPPIAKARFLDASGEPIASSRAGSSRMSMLGSVTTTVSYRLSRKVPKATVQFVVWDDVQSVDLPLDLIVDVGP